jgi:hypothetical protein
MFKLHGKGISHNFQYSESNADTNFAFHPTLPLLVSGGKRKTFEWHLDAESKLPVATSAINDCE